MAPDLCWSVVTPGCGYTLMTLGCHGPVLDCDFTWMTTPISKDLHPTMRLPDTTTCGMHFGPAELALRKPFPMSVICTVKSQCFSIVSVHMVLYRTIFRCGPVLVAERSCLISWFDTFYELSIICATGVASWCCKVDKLWWNVPELLICSIFFSVRDVHFETMGLVGSLHSLTFTKQRSDGVASFCVVPNGPGVLIS